MEEAGIEEGGMTVEGVVASLEYGSEINPIECGLRREIRL